MSDESMIGIFFAGGMYPVTEHPFGATPTRIDEINGITFIGHIIMTLDDTMTQYQTARAQYKQLIASVYAETDPTRKAAIRENSTTYSGAPKASRCFRNRP